jgi:hypothetical protein
VISTAAASPARRHWRKRSDIAVAELAPQPFDATNAGRLAPEVAARVVEAMAGAAGNGTTQAQRVDSADRTTGTQIAADQRLPSARPTRLYAMLARAVVNPISGVLAASR